MTASVLSAPKTSIARPSVGTTALLMKRTRFPMPLSRLQAELNAR
jgi:hypothetical protein